MERRTWVQRFRSAQRTSIPRLGEPTDPLDDQEKITRHPSTIRLVLLAGGLLFRASGEHACGSRRTCHSRYSSKRMPMPSKSCTTVSFRQACMSELSPRRGSYCLGVDTRPYSNRKLMAAITRRRVPGVLAQETHRASK